MNIFLSISFNICFGCSKESSRRDDSFEYPQHMFWLRNKTIKVFDNKLISRGLGINEPLREKSGLIALMHSILTEYSYFHQGK